MKLAVLGGSFNPVHIGHLILADCVSKQLGYDKIAFVPAYDPPHKYLSMEVSAQDRLKMVELATEDDERFFAEDFEINQKQAEISLMASNKSLQSTKMLIEEYKGGLKNCGMEQEQFLVLN